MSLAHLCARRIPIHEKKPSPVCSVRRGKRSKFPTPRLPTYCRSFKHLLYRRGDVSVTSNGMHVQSTEGVPRGLRGVIKGNSVQGRRSNALSTGRNRGPRGRRRLPCGARETQMPKLCCGYPGILREVYPSVQKDCL